ncbi:MAG: sugar nucleotide-binding protein, partial [Pseudoalteromonas sp.]|nr:sugar nucleotide-binding protein [Pseudoalteromonas sp.]
MSKLVVIGKSGQLAWEIARLVPDAVCMGRDDMDINSAEDIAAKLAALKPEAVINASAYTAVDKAESDEENAYLLNQTAVANLAKYCKSNNVFFVHVS